MGIQSILIVILSFINLLMIALAIKIVKRKGGISFLKLFLSKKRGVPPAVTDKLKEFSAYKRTDKDIVFLGDSITMGAPWSEFFPEFSCRNRGIGGETTGDVLKRIDSISVGKPQKVFLLIGINDFLSRNPKNLLINYKLILENLKELSPATEIFVQSILPINKKMCENILSIKKNIIIDITNQDIIKANNELKVLCSNMGVTFIESFQLFTDNQVELSEKLTTDGVHLSFEGYLKLAEILEKYICDNEVA